jgi:hypothetical protein
MSCVDWDYRFRAYTPAPMAAFFSGVFTKTQWCAQIADPCEW